MAFIETPRFPPELSYYASGGPEHLTQVVVVSSGYEKRNVAWSSPRSKYDIAQAMKTDAGKNVVISFFRSAQGRANAFRFQDWSDYTDAGSGILGTGVGTALPTYQLYKTYNQGGLVSRKISKPLTVAAGASTPFVVLRGGSPVTAGAAAGNYALDSTTGIVTFVADATQVPTSITPGASTTLIVNGTDNLALTTGKVLYLSGVTGTAANMLNGANTITGKSGSGPWTYTLATVTTGLTVTGVGTAYKYPQASDALTWTGQFDTPVRFDTDVLQGYYDTGLYVWGTIPLIEVKL